MDNPPPISFLEKTYALSIATQYPQRGQSSRGYVEYLPLLDAIALLLARSDNAAVALERKAKEVVLYWAMNRPATRADKKHLVSLFEIVNEDRPRDVRVEGVLVAAMKGCKSELVWRMEKLKTAIGNNKDLISAISGAAKNIEFCEYLESALFEYFDVTDPLDFVLGYFRCFEELDIPTLSPDELGILVRLASVVGWYDHIAEIVKDPVLVRRLWQVGDYLGACKEIVIAVDQHRGLDIRFIPVSRAVPLLCCDPILTESGRCASSNFNTPPSESCGDL